MIDLTPYAGLWVALVGDLVAGVGNTPEEAKRLAQHNRPRERPFLHFVEAPGGEPLHLSPLLDKLRPFLQQQDNPVYLVGGAVRDALLGVVSHDLDFAVPQNAIALTFKVANSLGQPAYILDRERDAGRVVLQAEDSMLDFACFRGADLLADLAERDFTINALALPATAVTTASIIDPFNGLADLAHKQIRLVQPHALSQDPVRALRAVRQALSYDFTLTADTKTAVIAAAPLLHRSSTERIRDELVKVLATAVPDQAIRQLAELKLLAEVLPEIDQLALVEQSAPHHEGVLAHTISVLYWLVMVETAVAQQTSISPALNAVQAQFAEFSGGLQTHLSREIDGGLNGRLLLRLAAVFHDVGKKATQTIDETGHIRFWGHELVGAELTAARLRRLAFSKQALKWVETAVAGHMRPLQLAQTSNLPSRRAIYRYFRATQETGLDIGLLSLADHLATYNGVGDEAQWQNLVTVVAELFRHYFEQYEETVAPELLINGRDLMQLLHIPAGPEIGRILRLVREAQAAGDLNTREQALDFAQKSRH